MSQELLRRLGANIRHLRLTKGLSQERLAELTGLHRTYIGGVERGERNISLLNLARLAHALEASLSELTCGVDK
ncbi:Subunit S of type I restriction-modification system [Candidatus Promineifilum breve]|uniref:Subunit S of type I restriction-modification system n=1 Tax=Candidatus Promineifilum breve TaxID=1806508 RepID=A0A160T594_9CHLR|nr:helix-turn-helix transcriptional regulator [Candidatus Promineifilum breve]CUS03860.2 Subunit S of type I restriction-modification system [Candidatus Promineifilum breve]